MSKKIDTESRQIKETYEKAIRRICVGLAFAENDVDQFYRAAILGKLMSLFIESDPIVGINYLPDMIDEKIKGLIENLPYQEKIHLVVFLKGLSHSVTLFQIEESLSSYRSFEKRKK